MPEHPRSKAFARQSRSHICVKSSTAHAASGPDKPNTAAEVLLAPHSNVTVVLQASCKAEDWEEQTSVVRRWRVTSSHDDADSHLEASVTAEKHTAS